MVGSHDLPVPFEVRLMPDRDRLLVAPRGELDLATAEQMRVALLEQFDNGFAHVVADLRDVTFIDSIGIGVLAQAVRHGADIEVRGAPPKIQRAIELSGLIDPVEL